MISSPFMPDDGEQRPSGPPEYKVYRSRQGLFSRLRKPDLSEPARARARRPAKRPGGAARARPSAGARAPAQSPAAQAGRSNGSGSPALGWILLSFLAFAVSAQLQSFKLSGEAKDALHGNPFLLPSPQTILVLGTDARPPDTKEPGAAPSRGVLRAAGPRRRPARRLLGRASSAPTR